MTNVNDSADDSVNHDFVWAVRYAHIAARLENAGVYVDRDREPLLLATTQSGGYVRAWGAASSSPGEGPTLTYTVHRQDGTRIGGGHALADVHDLAQVVSNDHGEFLTVRDCDLCGGLGVLYEGPDNEAAGPWANDVKACQTCRRYSSDESAARYLARVLCGFGAVPDYFYSFTGCYMAHVMDPLGRSRGYRLRADFPEACMDAQQDLGDDDIVLSLIVVDDPMPTNESGYRSPPEFKPSSIDFSKASATIAPGLFVALVKIAEQLAEAYRAEDPRGYDAGAPERAIDLLLIGLKENLDHAYNIGA